MTSTWIHQYETVKVESNSLAMEKRSRNIGFAIQLDSGRIIHPEDLDLETYEEGGGCESLICLVCSMMGYEDNDSYLMLTPRGIRDGFFQHQQAREHTEEEIWRICALNALTEFVRSQTHSAVIETGTLDAGSFDGDIVVSTRDFNVAIEVQSNYAFKDDLRLRHGLHKGRESLDQWIYPPHLKPEILMKDYRNLVYGTGSLPTLGRYLVALKVTSNVSHESETFYLSINRESLVRKNSSAKPFEFERTDLMGVMTSLDEWSFGKEGITPSWGTSAFNLEWLIQEEEKRLDVFLATKHKPNKKATSTQTIRRTPPKTATGKPPVVLSGDIKSKVGNESVIPWNTPPVTPDQFDWFIRKYFEYSSFVEERVSSKLGKALDFKSLSGTFQPKDAEEKIALEVIQQSSIFWNITKLQSDVYDYTMERQWLGIIDGLIRIHNVNAQGKTKSVVAPKPYTGDTSVEGIRNHLIDFEKSREDS